MVGEWTLTRRLRWTARTLALVAVGLAILTLFGWHFDVTFLKSVSPTWPTMKPNTAICFILIGLSLCCFSGITQSKGKDYIRRILATLTGLIGLVSLLEYQFTWLPNIDQVVLEEVTSVFPGPFGRMAPVTGLNFFLLAIALLLLDTRFYRIAQAAAITCLATSLIAFQCFFYGIEFLLRVHWYAAIAFHTTIGFICCSISVCFTSAERNQFPTLLTEPGSSILRRIIPLFVIFSLLVGWLRLEGERMGLYSGDFGVALHSLLNIIFVTIVQWNVARSLNKTQAALTKARQKLERYAETLEARVAERTAQLQNSVNSLQNVVYTIAHDLRAPLRAMTGFTEALLEDCSDRLGAENQDYCRRIGAAAGKMDKLITDLLAYGQVANTPVVCSMLDLNREIDSAIYELKPTLGLTHAEVKVDKPLPTVCAEKNILHQVLMNLVSNALKFARPGVTPQLHIFAERRADHVRLWFEDNGIGIAKQYCDKIFDIFQRLHGEEIPGTGMGLAIVKKGMEQMRGHVGVQSEPGKGSRFWIEMPITCATN